MAFRLASCAIWQPTAKLAIRTGPRLRTRLTHRLCWTCAYVQPRGSLLASRCRLLQTTAVAREMSVFEFEQSCKASLENLFDYFEELLEDTTDADVNLSDGVLTVKLGKTHGTYVINKQTPNKQIWLSSPISGPKRYDYIGSEWVYKHDGCSLNTLLTQEMRQILQNDQIDFSRCV